MLNKFEYSKLQSSTRNWTRISPTRKLIHVNLSQGDSQSVRFTAGSYDLALPGVAPPLVGGLSAVLFHLYSAADMSIVPLITQ